MIRDPRESQQRLHSLRAILRTMERAVEDAKFRRTAPVMPAVAGAGGEHSPTASAQDSDRGPFNPLGRGRDIPGPETLPRAKAKPKSFGGLGIPRPPFGRTG